MVLYKSKAILFNLLREAGDFMLITLAIVFILTSLVFKTFKILRRFLAAGLFLGIIILVCSILFYQSDDKNNPFLQTTVYKNIECNAQSITYKDHEGFKVLNKSDCDLIENTKGQSYLAVIDVNTFGKLFTVNVYEPKYLLYLNSKDDR